MSEVQILTKKLEIKSLKSQLKHARKLIKQLEIRNDRLNHENLELKKQLKQRK